MKIESVDFISDSIVLKNQNFEFDLKPVEEVLSIEVVDSERCYEEEHKDAIHFIKNIRVSVMTNFTSEYPENSEINDLISVKFYNSDSHKIETKKLYVWIDYMKGRDGERANAAEFQNAGSFIIIQKPTIQPRQKFSLLFSLSDGTTRETITNDIVWK